MPAAIETSTLFQTGKATLEFSRSYLLSMLEGIPADKLTHQPVPGANHALWILGHVAWCDDFFLAEMTRKPALLPKRWAELFANSTKPQPDAKAYPSLEELKSTMQRTRAALITWFEGMDEAELLSPLPEDWKTFAPTYAALMSVTACHESTHTGQLTVVRRSLNIPPRF